MVTLDFDVPDIVVEDLSNESIEIEQPVKVCPHLRKCCRPRRIEPKIRELRDKEARVCRTCLKDAGKHDPSPESAQLWMCLCCGHLFCGRYDKAHAAKHHEKAGDSDCIMFNIESLTSWCYLCDDAIRTATNRNEILLHVKKYWLKHAEVSSQENPEAIVVDPKLLSYRVISPGLVNLGNTCYFNSVMQVMAAVEQLHDIIAPHPFEERSELEIRSSSALTTNFTSFLNDFYKSEQEKTILKPAALFSEIHRKFPRFTRGAQQDAQELLHYLLEGLKADETGPKGERPECKRMRSRRRTLNEEEIEMTERKPQEAWKPSNYIESIFEGRLASVVVCSVCKSISTTYDQFEELSLSIVQQEKTGKERRSRFRAAIDDLGRRSRNSLSLTRSTSTRQGAPLARPAANNRDAVADDGTFPSEARSPGLKPGLSPTKAPQISMSEAVSEEEDAVAEKQLKTHTFSMSEAKTRLERLSFGFGRSRANGNTPNEDLLSPSMPVQKRSKGIPEASVDRLQYIDRLLQEPDNTAQLRRTIEESLRDFTSVECLEDENAFACEECAKLMYDASTHSQRSDLSEPCGSDEMDGVITTGASPIEKSFSSSSCAEVEDAEMMSIDSRGTPAHDSKAESKLQGPVVSKPKHILRKAYKRFMVADLPNILVLHLKRFQQSGKSIYSSLKKVDDIVRFEEELDMGPYLMPNPESDTTDSLHYRCIGCVVHIGTINSGHYVAYFLSHKVSGNLEMLSNEAGSKERQWVFASDSMVRPATWAEISKSRAYIIFYERVR